MTSTASSGCCARRSSPSTRRRRWPTEWSEASRRSPRRRRMSSPTGSSRRCATRATGCPPRPPSSWARGRRRAGARPDPPAAAQASVHRPAGAREERARRGGRHPEAPRALDVRAAAHLLIPSGPGGLSAADEGLDVVRAVAVGGSGDALLELSQEVGEETGGALLALARKARRRSGSPQAATLRT